MTLRPTHRQVAAARYLRPGGAWDVPTLDRLAAAAPVPVGSVASDSATRLGPVEMDRTVAAVAGGLRAAGVRRRDAVAWQLPNRVEVMVLFRACWRIGAVAVPIHHQLGPAEVDAMVEAVDPRLVLADADLPLSDRQGALEARIGTPDWESLLKAPAVSSGTARPADLAVALFTSGSTGKPKAALHTHRALAHKALTMARAHGLRPSDVVLMPAPLAHISGLLSGVLLPAAVGMRTELMERWDAERALTRIRDEQVTFMIGPPVYFSAMAEASGCTPDTVASLRIISCGSMPVSPEFVDAAREAFGATVKRTYGSTEAPTVTTWAWDDSPERARDTDGRVVGQAELRLADPVTGRAVGPGGTGELELRGPELFVGYADPGQTKEAFRRGWFRTGDLATVDPEGWLTIVGRARELIIRGGENIVPAEVERVLEAHPAVRQAVVVGYPDPHLGERVAAFVVSDRPMDVEECRRWCEDRGLARFKRPDRVGRLETVPTRSLGKPDRAALRALAASGRQAH